MKIKTTNHLGRSLMTLCLFCLIGMSKGSAETGTTDNTSPELKEMLKYYGKQIYFTQNEGQFNDKVLYKADFPLGQSVVTKEGMIVSIYDQTSISAREAEGEQIEKDIQSGLPWKPMSTRLRGHSWMMDFVSSSPDMKIESRDAHTDNFNYFTGKTSLTNVKNYGEVWYTNVYNKVDVRYYPSAEGTLEYDIICKPGFNKSEIGIRFDGIEQMSVKENGHLVLNTSVGPVDFPSPVVYQQVNGVQKSITAHYIIANNVLKFQLGDYDASLPLIIDPIALRWATWVNTNSTGDNHGHCIWVDPSDRAIYVVARVVGSTDQITTGAFDVSANGNLEMIIGKYLEPTTVGGSGTRVWQTYVGGSGDDNPYAMEQGPDGNLYITGYTSSSNFPLIGGTAFNGGGNSIDQRNQTTDNIFILKINRAGDAIKSSVIGGDGDDGGFDLRINEAGDIVVCGNVNSNNLGTLYAGTGATNRANPGNGIDVGVFKINSDLSTISWMKNYGGGKVDQATIMVQDVSSGDIYIGGYTKSSDFATLSARQATFAGTQCGFIQKLSSTGTVVWSSYFTSAAGKSSAILCMEFNRNKNELYFGGVTEGLDAANISSGSFQPVYGGGDSDFFVCRMDISQNFIAGTYLGGSGYEVNMMGLNTDLNNDVYIFGYTNSTNFPLSSFPSTPLQSSNMSLNDKVFVKLSSDLATLKFSTYYGGSADDYDPVGERGIKFSDCRIYTIVTSKSNNIPLTQGSLNTTRVSTTPYEPGLVVWANPPDLIGNTILGNQTICAGSMPGDLTGSEPAYVLPTIVRNSTASTYPTLGSATTYQWQISTDSSVFTDIAGATSRDLLGTTIGVLNQKTFFRRTIGGDACFHSGAADQVVTVRIVSVSADVTNVSCNGQNDGSITAHSDGVPPLQYSWNTGSTDGTISGLMPGSYMVTVTDNGNCTATNSFTISEPAAVNSNAGPDKQITCTGTTTLTASSMNGTGFAWSTTNGNIVSGANTATITVDAVGTYVFTVTNTANGCTGSDTAYVTSLTQNTSSSATAVICNGGSFVLPDGTTQTTGGVYISHIPNAAGCDSTITTTLSVSSAITTTTNASFCDNSSFTLPWGTVVSVADDYTFHYQSIGGCDSAATIHLTSNSTFQTSRSASICPGGSYSLPWGASAPAAGSFAHTYTSVSGCDSVVTFTITLNQSYNTSQTASTCQGLAYNLPWGGTATTSGSYPHTYTSQLGCDSIATIILTVNPPIATTTNVSLCSGGSYQFPWGGSTAIAGNFPHTYTAISGCDSIATIHVTLNQPYTSSSNVHICQGRSYTLPWGTIVNVAANYTHTYQTTAGCDSIVTIHLYVDPLPTCGITGNTSICQGQSTVLSAPSGMTSYSWNTGSTSRTITVTASGTYTVTVTNSGGCTSSSSKTVTVNPIPVCNITGNTNICQGQSTTLSAAAGYSYRWSNGSTSRSITVSTAGTYSVTLSTIGCSCTSTCHVTVCVTPMPVCSISGRLSICSGQTTTLSAPAGAATYRWNTGATSRTITVSTGGVYTVTVSNGNGCSCSCSRTVVVNPTPPCNISGNTTICQGSTTTLSAPAGYSYLWSNGSTSRSIIVSCSGTYSVTVTNGSCGCASTCQVCVNVIPRPNFCISGNTVICRGQSNVLSAPWGYSSYHWSTGANSRTISVSCPGTYTCTVSNSNGCTGCASICVSYGRAVHCRIVADPKTGETTAIVDGGVPPYKYVWNNNEDESSSTLTLKNSGDVTVTVTDAENQKAVDQAVITLDYIEVSVYPNPLTTFTTIEFRNAGSAKQTLVEVYDMNGRLVDVLYNDQAESNKLYKLTWNAEKYRQGIYLYRITSGDNIINGKLMLEN